MWCKQHTINEKQGIHTPRRNAVPFIRQSSASIFVAFKASCMEFPEAMTAQTIAPADEPANGVVSWDRGN